jgi:hypothetical protein
MNYLLMRAAAITALGLLASVPAALSAPRPTTEPTTAPEPGIKRPPIIGLIRALPTSPATLTAKTVAFRTVDLSWTPVPGVSQYRIYGPTSPPEGLLVTAQQPVRIFNVPTGGQTFAISTDYPGVTQTPGLAQSLAIVLPFYNISTGFFTDIDSLTVDFMFFVSASDTLTFHLYRDDGRGGEASELGGVAWNRYPQSQAAIVQIGGRTFPYDLKPGLEYKYQAAIGMPNGDLIPTPIVAVRIPEFIVHGTIPLSGDRVVVEWNAFATAPYQVKKGIMASPQSPGSSIAFDFVRDAAGNAINFAGNKFEDFVVQHGVRYAYEVCAQTVAPFTPGYACPGVSVMVP